MSQDVVDGLALQRPDAFFADGVAFVLWTAVGGGREARPVKTTARGSIKGRAKKVFLVCLVYGCRAAHMSAGCPLSVVCTAQ